MRVRTEWFLVARSRILVPLFMMSPPFLGIIVVTGKRVLLEIQTVPGEASKTRGRTRLTPLRGKIRKPILQVTLENGEFCRAVKRVKRIGTRISMGK